MEAELRRIAGQYFAPETIESVRVFNRRAIVTLVNAAEDPAGAEAMEKALLAYPEIDKVSVVYTATRRDEGDTRWRIPGVKKIIAVASGKGGVGNLALALADLGKKTALFDADIYGPSVPTMLGFEDVSPISYDGKTFEPFENLGLKSMSIGSLVDKDTPLIWRGPKACGALQQLLTEVNWGDIDVMVIVSTPQDIALIDAVKGVNMFKRVEVPILGIVENMSYYLCPECGHKEFVFGEHGARETAERLGEKFLGEIPLNIKIRSYADGGTPIVYAEPDSPFSEAYREIAAKIAAAL